MKLSKIKPNPNNPRIIKDDKFEKLKKSIKDFPKMMELRPMVINSDNIVLGGNMRLKALKELGYKEVPDEWVKRAEDLTEDEQRQFIIKDNVGFGEHDWEMLATEWDADELSDWGLDIPNWQAEEVLEAEEDDFDATPPEEPKTVLGDLYEIGEHRLLCGDSTDSDQVAKLMNGEKADMVFTDPPYGLGGYGGRNNMELKNDDGNDEMICTFYSLPTYYEAREVYLWGNAVNLFKHLQDEPRDVIVWRKNNFGLGRGYRGQYELCFYFGDFDGSDSDVWDIAKDVKYEHPTQKPIALCERAIKNSNPKNVVDFFLGSGSTMVASHQLKRKCYGIELDPKYCDVIVKRMITLDPSLTIKRNDQDVTNEWK